jgi:hypothetical protein
MYLAFSFYSISYYVLLRLNFKHLNFKFWKFIFFRLKNDVIGLTGSELRHSTAPITHTIFYYYFIIFRHDFSVVSSLIHHWNVSGLSSTQDIHNVLQVETNQSSV